MRGQAGSIGADPLRLETKVSRGGNTGEISFAENVWKEGAMKPMRTRPDSIPKVHARGEARLDAMLGLAEEASRPAPLGDVLQSLCERIAPMLKVDVCSV